MTTFASLPVAAVRAGPCVRAITFVGLEMTDWSFAAEIRLGPDTPGAPLVALAGGVGAGAEGIRLVDVTWSGGVPTSKIELRIAEATLLDQAKVPYAGEIGDASSFSWALIGTPQGGDSRLLIQGPFIALPTTFGATNAPDDRIAGGSGSVSGTTWSQAQLTFGDDGVSVTITGIDLIWPLVGRIETAVASVEAQADALLSVQFKEAGASGDLSRALVRQAYYGSDGRYHDNQTAWLSTPMIPAAPGGIVCVSGVSQVEAAAIVVFTADGSAIHVEPGSNGITSVFYRLPAATTSFAATLASPSGYPNYPTYPGPGGNQMPVPASVHYVAPGDVSGDLSRFFSLYGYIRTDGSYHVRDIEGTPDASAAAYWRRTPPLSIGRGMEIAYTSFVQAPVAHMVFRDAGGALVSAVAARRTSLGTVQSDVVTPPSAAATVELVTFEQANAPNAAINAVPATFVARAATRAVRHPTVPVGGLLVLYGDSRMSTSFPINRTAWQTLLGCEVQNNGLAGHTVAQNAGDADLAAVFTQPGRDPDVIVWLPGGNDPGNLGTVGTFSATSVNGAGGEAVVQPLPLDTATPAPNAIGNSMPMIQSLDLAMRKIVARYADVRTRAGVVGSDDTAAVAAKLAAVVMPRLIVLTDLPQQAPAVRAGIDPGVWGNPDNWERKRQAIIEACRRNRIEFVDTMAQLQVHFGPQPPDQGSQAVYGDDYYDWLHPYLLQFRIARLVVGNCGLN